MKESVLRSRNLARKKAHFGFSFSIRLFDSPKGHSRHWKQLYTYYIAIMHPNCMICIFAKYKKYFSGDPGFFFCIIDPMTVQTMYRI